MADITIQDLLDRLGLPYTGTGCSARVDLTQLGGGDVVFDATTLTSAQCDEVMQCINEGATQNTITEFFERLEFTTITAAQCGPIFACILASGTAAQFTELLQQFDMGELTGGQCEGILQCVLDNGTTAQFTELLSKFNTSQLSAVQCQDIMQCIINNGTPALFTQFINKLDFTDLVAAQCEDVFACLIANGTPAQYVELLQNFDLSDLSPAQCRDIATCLTTDPSALNTLQASLVSNAVGASGFNIDLKPTGNANEFTVDFSWVDDNGNTQTTTDPTPVTFASGTVNFSTLTVDECRAIFDCINTNGTAAQFTTFINNVDFSTLEPVQCQAIVQCIIDNAEPTQLTALMQKLPITQLTELQCQQVFQCVIDNGTVLQLTELLQKFDLSKLTTAQQAALCTLLAPLLVSKDADNTIVIGGDGKLYAAAASGAVNGDLVSVELGNTLRLGDDGLLYADPALAPMCFNELGVYPQQPPRNVGPAAADSFSHIALADYQLTSFIGFWDSSLVADDLVITNVTTGDAVNMGPVDSVYTPNISQTFELPTPLLVNTGDLITFVWDNQTVGNRLRWSLSGAGHIHRGLTGASAGGDPALSIGLEYIVEEHDVYTSTDGEVPKLYEFDANGEPQELASIPTGWVPCRTFNIAEEARILAIAKSSDTYTKCIDCYTQDLGSSNIGNEDNLFLQIGDGDIVWEATQEMPQAVFCVHLEDNATGGVPLIATISGDQGTNITRTFNGPPIFDNAVVCLAPFYANGGEIYTINIAPVTPLAAGDFLAYYGGNNPEGLNVLFTGQATDLNGVPAPAFPVASLTMTGPEVKVVTLSDGSLRAADDTDLSQGIPATWEKCVDDPSVVQTGNIAIISN